MLAKQEAEVGHFFAEYAVGIAEIMITTAIERRATQLLFFFNLEIFTSYPKYLGII